MSIDIGLAVGFYFSLVSSYQGIFARPRKFLIMIIIIFTKYILNPRIFLPTTASLDREVEPFPPLDFLNIIIIIIILQYNCKKTPPEYSLKF